MLVQRYRVGTARRRARVWSSTVNIVGMAFSSALFVGGRGCCVSLGPERAHADSGGVRRWMSARPCRPGPEPLGTCRRFTSLHAEPLAGAGDYAVGDDQAGIRVLAELAGMARHAGLRLLGSGRRSCLTGGRRDRARALFDVLARRAPTPAAAQRENRTGLSSLSGRVLVATGRLVTTMPDGRPSR